MGTLHTEIPSEGTAFIENLLPIHTASRAASPAAAPRIAYD